MAVTPPAVVTAEGVFQHSHGRTDKRTDRRRDARMDRSMSQADTRSHTHIHATRELLFMPCQAGRQVAW